MRAQVSKRPFLRFGPAIALTATASAGQADPLAPTGRWTVPQFDGEWGFDYIEVDGCGLDGALANSRRAVKADDAARTFSADVGIDDSSAGNHAKVAFEVYGDGRLLARTPPIGYATPAHHLSAPVGGVRGVELVARQIGGDVAPVVVTWGNAALLDR